GIDAQIDAGDMAKAEKMLTEMAQKNPDNLLPQYFGTWNKIYKKKNQQDELIANWQQAIKTFPGNQNFKINLAFEYFHMKQLGEAEATADDIIKQNPKYTRAFILKSKIREKNGLLDEARVYLEKALALEPQNISLKVSLAKLLGKSKPGAGSNREWWARAGELCRNLLEENTVKNNPGMQCEIGIILTEIHNNDLAFKVLGAVTTVEKGSQSAEAWNYLGILHFRRGEVQKARDAYLKSIKLDPGSALTYNNIGTLYLTRFLKTRKRELHTNALEAFNNALKLNPLLVSALNGRGSAFKFANRVQEAFSDWQRILEINPGFTDAYFNIGVTYLQLKNKSNALKYLNQCKEKYYIKLSDRDKTRLDRLITEAAK
ncbi:MAG: tetratricopeptide repeat protein, partial [bacterium]|nr:tetratricopeptide repeat protein [bacterium]